ncbi:MAG: alkylation response protein AidB-like acyl-CoA dehydrogenase [Hyphomicrobiaceae bacterium]|jgi:alkylation response protein AidB-like acyl-CoA dehydrogenase
MSDRQDTVEQAEFRQYCRRWLDENRPGAPSFRLPLSPIEVMTQEQCDYFRAWQGKCHAAGLVGSDYPTEYGGHGHSGFQSIATKEMGHAQVPYMINVIGLSMAAPTILNHGTEDQKRLLLPKLLSAEEIWCQGFSEPGAGSDLAGAQTSAVRDGDNWIINGHKVWTSLAHFASWMILLARHSTDHKYNGLTYFVVPVANTEGVTVRPLIKMTGETGFNEVLMENLVIPDTMRLDDVGKGWAVAMTTLTYERGAAEGAGAGGGVSLESQINELVELAKKTRRGAGTAWEDVILRDRIMALATRAEGYKQTMRRARSHALTDTPMRLPLQAKVLTSELMQDIADVGMQIVGASASLFLGDDPTSGDGHWPHAFMDSFGFTIAAGSNEIQRNILGERVLGMAKSK